MNITSSVIPTEAPGPMNTTILQQGATFGIVGSMGPGSEAGVTVEGVMTT